jgi:hypothetical protein
VRDAILYRARDVNPVVEREVKRLTRDLHGVDIFIVCYQPEYESAVHSVPGKVYCYGQRDLHGLPYPAKLCKVDWSDPTKRPPSEEGSEQFFLTMGFGNQDLVILKFFLDNPEYDRYWMIEDDVRCSGSWGEVFAELDNSGADLLLTVVQNYWEVPNWYWWTHMSTGDETVALDQRVKGFLPFCRVSAACLKAIDEKYRQGWGGHYEVTWPSIARASDLLIEDIGGRGAYTPAERRGRFYTCTSGTWHLFPGTFVFRPPFHDMGVSEFGKDVTPHCMLWHPVKS